MGTKEIANEARIEAAAARLISTSPSGGGLETTFVYRPGAVAPVHPVYATWPALYAAFSLVAGPKWIQVDTSLQGGAAAIVPAGTYNVDGVTWTSQNEDTLSFADGTRLVATFMRVEGGVTLSADGTTPLWVPATTFSLLAINEHAIVQGTTTPFMHLTAAASPANVLLDGGSFLGDGANVALLCDGGQLLVVDGYSNSTLEPSCLSGPITLTLDDTVPLTSQPAAVLTTTFTSLAAQTDFTPAVPGNWHPAPTLTNAALDQLAARAGRVLGTANQIAGATATGGAVDTAIAGPTAAFTPNGVTPVRLAGFGGGVMAVGVTSCWLQLETSIDAGVTWTVQKRTQFSGIPDGVGGVSTLPEFMAATVEAFPTLGAVSTLARLSVLTTNGGATAFVAGAANEGLVVAQQF